ncbi:MAG: DUF1585 domain-containing protein [Deltaproteobacteria bacterium]|nr:MAG: DUF1585 domain-containing protein [Deltaproteobacteria bacterium]
MRLALAAALALGLTASCGEPGASPSAEEPEDGLTLLSPRRQLIRLSVDLRGVHPSASSLDFIEEHPEAYESFVDRYLYDPRFVDRMEEIWNYSIRTRNGSTYFNPAEAGMRGMDRDRIADSIGDEPLKLISHVIENDLPFSEVLTADYSMADPIVARMWGLPYPEGESGWQVTAYDDGRPLAGVLSSTTLWQRYPSAGVNSNRHRANTVSRVFLCDDQLSRPVSFSRTQIDTLTSGDPEDVIQTTQACQSCHSTLDSFSSHFFGFWWEVEGGLFEQTTYRPEDEPLWRYQMGTHVSPAYFGVPTSDLREMAHQLAQDPRFVQCATDTLFAGLSQRNLSDIDRDERFAHRRAFEDSGLIVREMVRSIVTSRPYRAERADAPELQHLPVLKTVTPAQLEGIIAAKTGYRWTIRGRPVLARNIGGVGVLAGGTDGDYVTAPNYDPSVGLALVQERLAQAAGWHVASHDLARDRAEDPILLRYVSRDDRPETHRDAFKAQIEQLYFEVLGVPLDAPLDDDGEPIEAPEVEELIAMWKQLYSLDARPESAWAGVVSVVLRDPMLIFY